MSKFGLEMSGWGSCELLPPMASLVALPHPERAWDARDDCKFKVARVMNGDELGAVYSSVSQSRSVRVAPEWAGGVRMVGVRHSLSC